MDAATMVCSKFGNFKPKSAIKSTGGGSGFRHAVAVRTVPAVASRADFFRQILKNSRGGVRYLGTTADHLIYGSRDCILESMCLDELDFDFDENLFFELVVPLEKYDPLGRHLLVIGFGYQKEYPTALWQLQFTHASKPAAVVYELSSLPHVDEAAFVSRCNRFEIYALVLDPINALEELCAWMSKESGIPLKKLRFCCDWHFGRDAWRHLFEATSGLRNFVPEGGNLGQVREIANSLDGFRGFGRILKTLFEHAISVGEKVTSEVKLPEDDDLLISLTSAAVELTLSTYWDFPVSDNYLQRRRYPLPRTKAEPQILVIGASRMSFLVIMELVRRGYKSITLVQGLWDDTNMEFSSREYRIKEEGGQVTRKPWEDMASCKAEADVVFAFKLASWEYHDEPYIHKDDVFRYNSSKEPPPTHLKLFVDTSLPHSIDEDGVSHLSFTCVLNMDGIEKTTVKKREEGRFHVMERARGYIEEDGVSQLSFTFVLNMDGIEKATVKKREEMRFHVMERARGYIEEEVGKFESWFNKWGAVHIFHSVWGFMKLKYARELEERRAPHVVGGSPNHYLWKQQVERVSRARASRYMKNFIAQLDKKVLADLPPVDGTIFPFPRDDYNASKNEEEELMTASF